MDSPPDPEHSAIGLSSDDEPVTAKSLRRSQSVIKRVRPVLNGTQLGEELPRNVQELLGQYYEASSTNIVPSEIYCIQAHVVHRNNNDRRAVYQCYRTLEHMEVKGYTLPAMRKEANKGSEQLLVAVGRTIPQPIVLARTKPHSGKFRAWQGVADDGTGPVVIQRYIPDHGSKVDNKRSASSTPRDRATKKKLKAEERIEVPGAGLQVQGSGLTPFISSMNMAVGHYGAMNPYAPMLSTSDERRAASRTPQARFNTYAETNHLTPSRGAPAEQEPSSVAEDTVLHFISSASGQVVRRRTLAKTQRVELLFAHAYAANTLTAANRFPVVEATIGEAGETMKIVDEDDFNELIASIVRDNCWESGLGCDVYMTSLGAREAKDV